MARIDGVHAPFAAGYPGHAQVKADREVPPPPPLPFPPSPSPLVIHTSLIAPRPPLPPPPSHGQVKVSKEVAKQRRLEAGLLSGYQRFLQLLESRSPRAM